MENVSKFIGYLKCETCGYQYITDANSVMIWYAPDCIEQMVEAVCSRCKKKMKSEIDNENFIAFRTHGVRVSSLSDRFPTLTEEEIDEWDANRDLETFLK